MPMDRSRYPADWDDIAREVKDRAGWKCEECGVEHDSYILRDNSTPEGWHYLTHEEECNFTEGLLKGVTRVIITVHHKGVEKPDGSPGDPNDKMDCRPENLIALCQLHHFLADQANNVALSRGTRIRKKHEEKSRAGQQRLFE